MINKFCWKNYYCYTFSFLIQCTFISETATVWKWLSLGLFDVKAFSISAVWLFYRAPLINLRARAASSIQKQLTPNAYLYPDKEF